MKKVTYYQPNAKDPVLDEKIVLEIVKKYDKTVDKVDFVDETGGEARAYSINDRLILKVQRPHRLRDKTSLEREVVFLNHLRKYPEISVPVVYGYGTYQGIEYTCMSKIKGKAFRYVDIPSEKRSAILEEVGKTLFKIHNIDNEPLITSGLFPTDTLEDLLDRLEHEFTYKLNRIEDLNEKEKAYAKELANKLLKTILKEDEYVVLHSNPATTHTFVTEDFNFSGLIDFGDAYISHPVLDLKRWNKEDRKTVVKGYFSNSEPTKNFQQLLDVSYALEMIIELLETEKSVSNYHELSDLR